MPSLGLGRTRRGEAALGKLAAFGHLPELGTALPLSGPDAGAAAGDDPAVTGAAAGCAVEFGLAACAFAIAGANAPKNSAAASARFFKIMAQM